jgi:hypothetical protein
VIPKWRLERWVDVIPLFNEEIIANNLDLEERYFRQSNGCGADKLTIHCQLNEPEGA